MKCCERVCNWFTAAWHYASGGRGGGRDRLGGLLPAVDEVDIAKQYPKRLPRLEEGEEKKPEQQIWFEGREPAQHIQTAIEFEAVVGTTLTESEQEDSGKSAVLPTQDVPSTLEKSSSTTEGASLRIDNALGICCVVVSEPSESDDDCSGSQLRPRLFYLTVLSTSLL